MSSNYFKGKHYWHPRVVSPSCLCCYDSNTWGADGWCVKKDGEHGVFWQCHLRPWWVFWVSSPASWSLPHLARCLWQTGINGIHLLSPPSIYKALTPLWLGHYLNQCWLIENWTLMNKIQWNLHLSKKRNQLKKWAWKYCLQNCGQYFSDLNVLIC